jgi:hypothetical protein
LPIQLSCSLFLVNQITFKLGLEFDNQLMIVLSKQLSAVG